MDAPLSASLLAPTPGVEQYKTIASLDDTLRRSSSARSMMDQTFRSIQTSISETNASLDAERERGMMLVSQRVDTEKKITEAESLHRKLTIDLARLKNQFQLTIQRVQKERIKGDAVLFEAANNSLNASRKRLQLAKEKEHTVNAKLLRVQSEYDEASKQEKELKQKADRQDKKLQNVRNEIRRLKADISKLKADTRALTIAKNSEEDTQSILNETLNELKERVITRKNEINELKTSQTLQINNIQNEIKTLRGELNDIVCGSNINQSSSNRQQTGLNNSGLFDTTNDIEYMTSFDDPNNNRLLSLKERRAKEEAEVQKLIQTSNKLEDLISEGEESRSGEFMDKDVKQLENEVFELKNKIKKMKNQINEQKNNSSSATTSSQSYSRSLLQNFSSNISTTVQEKLQELPKLLDDFATSQTEPRKKIKELQKYWEELKTEKVRYKELLVSILEDTKKDVEIFKKRYIAQNEGLSWNLSGNKADTKKAQEMRKSQLESSYDKQDEDMLKKRLEKTLEYERELKERIDKARMIRVEMANKVEVLQKELDRLLEEERKCREEMRKLQVDSAEKEEAYKQQILRLSQSLKHYQRLEEEEKSKNSFSEV